MTYTSLDTPHHNDFWWGLTNIGAATDGPLTRRARTLTFAGFSADGLTAIYHGTTTVQGVSGPISVATELDVKILSSSSGHAHWVLGSDVGLTGPAIQPADRPRGFDAFKVNVAWFANDGGPNQPFLDFYDANRDPSTQGQAITKSDGQFLAAAGSSGYGGNDTITGGNNIGGTSPVTNTLYGDGNTLSGNVHGGADTLIAGTATPGSSVINNIWGDAPKCYLAQPAAATRSCSRTMVQRQSEHITPYGLQQ